LTVGLCFSATTDLFDPSAKRGRMQAVANLLGIDRFDPGVVVIGDVVFVGATLWTNFELLRNSEREMSIAMKGLKLFLERLRRQTRSTT
jgi:small ligand-binding sensory domain FIST